MAGNAEAKTDAISITSKAGDGPILVVTGAKTISLKAGTSIEVGNHLYDYDTDTPISIEELAPGCDYAVGINALGDPFAKIANSNPMNGPFFAGFHFAPCGNAIERQGGDTTPAINPHSLWDIDFRPSCPDPRGMVRVFAGHIVWVDIYLLGVNHADHGTSRIAVAPATGRTLDLLDYATAKSIIESHGKRLLTYDEFRAAAFGVTERSSADDRPKLTGLDTARTSRFGIMQATGNLWIWGTDGDPDDPRPSVFGGSWFNGSLAGSRCANLDYWAEDSGELIGARGASDHLSPA